MKESLARFVFVVLSVSCGSTLRNGGQTADDEGDQGSEEEAEPYMIILTVNVLQELALLHSHHLAGHLYQFFQPVFIYQTKASKPSLKSMNRFNKTLIK